MDTPLIELRNVSKSFGNRVVLDRVNLRIYKNQVTTIIGKSGVGKSVLLKHIIGLIKPDAGEILFEGRPLRELTRKERKALKGRVAYMFQNNALFDSMTVFQNIALPLKEKTRMGEAAIRKLVMEKIEALELAQVPDKYPSQLSGGMQKRVALARALVSSPEVVLFDEPTTGLDPIRKNAVLSMIAHYQKRFGFTAVLVSHDIPDVFYISSRIAIIDEGRTLFEGTPIELEQSRHEVVGDFINSLESLTNELVGLENRTMLERHFREFTEGPFRADTYVVFLFTIAEFERIKEDVGHLAAQFVLEGLMRVLRTYFGAVGFSGRYRQDKVVAVLPRTSEDEAERIMERMAEDMQGLDVLSESQYPKVCVDFVIEAAWVAGESGEKLDELVAKAESRQKPLASLSCKATGL